MKYNYSETFECDGMVQDFMLDYVPVKQPGQALDDFTDIFIDKGDGVLHLIESGVTLCGNIITAAVTPKGAKLIVNYNRPG